MTYDNLPAVFEYARILKGSDQRVQLTYEEYLVYKESYESSMCNNINRDRAERICDTIVYPKKTLTHM
jgi:hypothetical protein